MSIIEIRGASKIYRQGEVAVRALDNVDLTIEKGEFSTLCGPSGSGKTTLLNVIGALDVPTSGDIRIENVSLSRLSKTALSHLRRDRIGFVFQSYNLVPVLSAYENAEFILVLQGVKAHERRERIMSLLHEVGLGKLAHRRPNELSGGQQQRVAIVRAIASHPAIVLADEPTANLDTKTASDLLDMMQELNVKHHITFLFSTHDQRV
ncbi:MAG TPA: macrolide ABC transporter ATP-binding protein, partial [Gammaproteobacteria bacterium]|nr:macrolide ABC transporter ATP-binding protein [Gammaproteobacteria bacterium]